MGRIHWGNVFIQPCTQSPKSTEFSGYQIVVYNNNPNETPGNVRPFSTKASDNQCFTVWTRSFK